MKYLIIIAIVYWILSRMRGQGRPQMPPPVPRREPAEPDYHTREDDRPLRGPWDPSTGDDKPLRGPWDPSTEDNMPLPGPWDRPAPAGDPETRPTNTWDDGYETDLPHRYEEEPAVTPVPGTERNQDRERQEYREPQVLREPPPGEGISDYPASALLARASETPGQPDGSATGHKRAPGPETGVTGRDDLLAGILQHRGSLAASIILGEALARRGGRQRR